MGPGSAEARRRIRRLRWTAAILWLVWVIAAVLLYWLHRIEPHLAATPVTLMVSASALGLGVIWFIYIIYRIGQLSGDRTDGQ